MRARNIKPGFFKNEDLADAGPYARLLFAGLWCMADKAGRLEDRPRRIKAEIFPYDDKIPSVETLLNTLAKLDMIIRYKHGKKRFIQVINFLEHQSPHHTERESTIPSPDINGEATVNPPLEDGGNPPDSLIHGFTDSLIPDPLTCPPKTMCDKPKNQNHSRFPEFYDLYPKHVNRASAQKSWDKYKFTPDQQEEIIAALKKQLAGDNFSDDKKFIAGPEVWLNQRRWENEIIPKKGNGKTPSPSRPPDITDDDWQFYLRFKAEPYGTMEQNERFDLILKQIGAT